MYGDTHIASLSCHEDFALSNYRSIFILQSINQAGNTSFNEIVIYCAMKMYLFIYLSHDFIWLIAMTICIENVWERREVGEERSRRERRGHERRKGEERTGEE